MVENIFESRMIGHSRSRSLLQEAQRKKLHVDEIEVVDAVDTSTSLCLYIM